ncbi:2-octaprenyl-6-methoxyphenyl hydroxylase [Rhodobacterales bacterium 52_120_T64]|nr:2-octaprenyl-6-methoxyphenyl hydroxylase [Rhodobacterales bacterium 52_120_T64]
MERIETDILVAGGGVAGLCATAAFASAGFDTICVDPVPPITDLNAAGADLRSTAFLLPSVALLKESGLWQRLDDYASPLRIMRIIDSGGEDHGVREEANFDAHDIDRAAFGYNLPNWLLRREMVEHVAALPTARLESSVKVDRITPRTNEALVNLSDGRQVRAKMVVAADGRNSLIREQLGVDIKSWRYGQKALVFNVRCERPHENVSTEIHRSGGPFTLVPLPDQEGVHHCAVVWMDTGPHAESLQNMKETEFNAALNNRACGVLGKLELASKRILWPIIAQRASHLYGPRTALLAEAAHVIPPIGAQGLNMSLADLSTLVQLATEARDAGKDFGAPEVLKEYHRKRWPDMAARIKGVDILNRAAMAESQNLRDLRRSGLKMLYGLGPLRKAAMKAGLGA